MKRLELFEFEDFNWLPNSIRTGVTNLIAVLHKFFGTTEVLVDLITKCQKKVAIAQIVDLGSGSGGPMINVISQINQKHPNNPIGLVLTDKYPNTKIVERINNLKIPYVHYLAESVDAMHIQNAPKGLKTMVASFHHIKPEIAKKILESAAVNKEPIIIYEIAENNVSILFWWLMLPISLVILILMSLIMTLFVRPLTFSQLFFTYFIPIIPIVFAWDGQASIMRTYTIEDIKELVGEQGQSDYNWEISSIKNSNGKERGYYIFGY